MPLYDALPPGLQGYDLGEQRNRQEAQVGLQHYLGTQRLALEQQRAQQAAQMQPLQMELLKAEAQKAQGSMQDDVQRREIIQALRQEQDPAKQAQLLMMLNPEKALASRKPQPIMNIGPGATAFDPNSKTPLFTGPASPQRQNLLEQLFSQMPPAERAAAQRAYVEKQTTNAPRGTGSIVKIVDPNNPKRTIGMTQEAYLALPDDKRPALAGGQTNRPPTEFQGKAMMYGTKSLQAHDVLKSLEENIDQASLKLKQSTPLIGNMIMSDAQQEVDQAQRNFLSAVLRQESGAAISDSEWVNGRKQYFVQAGDGPGVIANKRRNRELVIAGFRKLAGPEADFESLIANSGNQGPPKDTRKIKRRGVYNNRKVIEYDDGTVEYEDK